MSRDDLSIVEAVRIRDIASAGSYDIDRSQSLYDFVNMVPRFIMAPGSNCPDTSPSGPPGSSEQPGGPVIP